jgi:hypothetical protein
MVRIAGGKETVERTMQVIANAVTVEPLRQALAVILPLRFSMRLAQTAEVTGLSTGWVSKQRNRFIQGKAVGGAGKTLHSKRRLLYSSRFCSKPARAAFGGSVKSSITLSRRCSAP